MRRILLLPLFLLLLYSCIILFVVSTSVNIVSIVDHTCIPSCLLKLFSILKSSSQPSAFEFYFLVMNDSIVTDLRNKLATCFPTTVFHIQLWSQNVPKTFPSLRMRGFEVPHIFARFYLPYIFPSVDRFIYLDNDMVTNADLIGLNSVLLFGNMFSGIIEANSMTRKMRPIGMLVESHPQYNLMLASSFNLTHPLVNNIISASQLVLMSTVSTGPYLNAGVFIVDAVLWRKHHITTLAEEIMTENANGSIFATNAGDQGVFYLLSEKYIFGLEARWNMRRLPKKTVLMLEKRTNQGVFTTGIVHFAGSTGGDATRLCRKPYYPLFKNAVQPLYLSVVSSFQRAFPDLFSSCDDLYIVCATCREILKKEVKEEMYNPGKGNFRWPPL